MALYSKLLGVVGTSFAIGVSGVAASGALRVANNVTALAARNAAGSGDLSLVGTDGSNNLLLGDTNTASILFGPASIGWAASVASPTISQPAATSDVAPQVMTFTCQAPFATATGTNRAPKGFIFNIGTSTNSGTTPGFLKVVSQGVNPMFALGSYDSSPTTPSFYMGVDPIGNRNGFVLQAVGAILGINAPGTGGDLRFTINNAICFKCNSTSNVTYFNGNTAISGGAANVIGMANATTDPTTNPSGGIIWWSSLTVGASKQRTSSGWTKTLCGNTSTTANTQLAVHDELPAFARITTSGNTMVVNVALATSTSHADLDIRVKIKIAVAGSGTTVGDCFSLRQLGEWRNVGGTLSLVGSLPAALLSVSSASLNTSTVVITTSGTNIVITVTVNASSGTLGTADCTVLVTPVYN